jgi:class 3 adenylate cyclase
VRLFSDDCPSCGNTNPANAKFCLECGHKLPATGVDAAGRPAKDTAAPQPSQIGSAERRQFTVMFCDLVGSTALSARLDPEDMREIMSAYHHRCAEVIGTSGGFVAKYMGDGVLAYFGYPQAHEDDAEQAVRCGLALVDAACGLQISHGPTLQVRIGIATGVVVVGDLIGESAAQEQGVIGETPNLAARPQTLAEPNQVVIASSTRRLTGGLFEYRDLGRVAFKGLSELAPDYSSKGRPSIDPVIRMLFLRSLGAIDLPSAVIGRKGPIAPKRTGPHGSAVSHTRK